MRTERFRGDIAVICCFFLLSLSARAIASTAEAYVAAEDLYTAGRYEDAAQAARLIGNAEGHALAARALLSKAVSEVPFDRRLPVLKEAEAEAETAIAANDKVVEGHLQRLVAYSLIARLPGSDSGSAAGAKVSRKIIDRALALEPNNPWALASLGAWNLEIVRRVPLGLSTIWFGANRANGIAAYEKALTSAPTNVIIRYEYGLALLSLDAGRYRKKAVSALGAAIALHTDDAFSRFLQTRSRRLLEVVAANDRPALNQALATYRGEAPETNHADIMSLR